jgi:predicted DNA-binding protein (MmcQ/YjbR family)
MVSEDDIVKYALGLGDVTERSDGELRLFERGEKIFLIVEKKTSPLRIETRCDRKLSKVLQERYESVMESRALGRNGIEIICSGQLSEEDIIDLIRHAYEVSAE